MKKTDAIAALAALAHSARLDVFRLLVASASPREGEGGLTPGQMAKNLGLPAPTLSFHLKELSRAGLVTHERRGRSLIYSPCVAALEALAGFLLDDCCKGVTARGAPTETKDTCL